MYKVILIGAGYWGKNFLRVLNELKEYYDFIGVVELDEKIRKSISIKYPNLKIFKDYTKTKNLCDIYLIATPISKHYEISKWCLENNSNIIVEKPLTDSVKKTEDLIEISKKYKRKIFVNFTPIYTDPYNFIIERYKNKTENIHYIECRRSNLGIIRNDCSVIEDLTCHDLSMLYCMLNEMPCENSIKVLGNKVYSDNIDFVCIQMKFPKSNIIVSLYTSWVDNEKKRLFSIIGKDEKLTYDDTKTNYSIEINKSFIQKDKDIEYFKKDIIVPYQDYNEPLKNQLIHYFHCLEENKEGKTNGEFSLQINKILDLIKLKLN